jgi:protein-S-isoprenylcysteine O-methyltransferase Ste14
MMRIVISALLIPIVVLALYFFIPTVKNQSWDTWRVTGAVIALMGYVCVVTARMQLGNSFSVKPEAKELVTHGLYARMRHPMYVFVDLMIVGVILALHLYRLLIPFVPLVVLQAIEARREAKVLREKFDQTYLAYRQQTWF